MRLYYIQGSPFARMVRVLLRELNIACDEIEITDFPPPRDYFTINPLGQVPVLETDVGRLFPTSAIANASALVSAGWRAWSPGRVSFPRYCRSRTSSLPVSYCGPRAAGLSSGTGGPNSKLWSRDSKIVRALGRLRPNPGGHTRW